MAYAELYCQSNFSYLQGASHPEELIRQADFLGYKALAITDECSVAGVVRAYTEKVKQDLRIELIIGSLFKLGEDLSLVLLCPNHQAYSELCRIISNARKRAEKGSYQLDQWDLQRVQHCLVIWCPSGIASADSEHGKWLSRRFPNRLWIGASRLLTNDETRYIDHCQTLAEQFQLPVTACGKILMHTTERLALQQVVSAIKAGTTVPALGRELQPNAERSLRPIGKLQKLYPAAWLQESVIIAQRCRFSLRELRDLYQYPQELVPKGKTAKAHLRELVLTGIKRRNSEGKHFDSNILRIIAKELKLISELGYEHYFLTIHDIVQFAQSQGILYQGRGSAANSVVCYCLAITAVDPRQINVLFERFISKERNEPPDIDVDFEHHRREEVIQYIYRKYGRERTALAATVITYRTRSAIREVGKALAIEETKLDFFIKNINRRDKAIGWQSQIQQLGLDTDSHQGRQFIHLVQEILGFPRHLSQHVGGFVIAASPLYNLVPIENAAMPDRTVIQWDKDDLESLYLLKVDVLALGMLSAIKKSFALIESFYQRSLSIAQITALGDDPKVYNMLQKADTVGVFQIESRAQMSMLPRLRPKCYYDLVVQIAIVRPGPIQGDMVHPFLRRRDGKEAVEYPSPEVQKVLERTMGVPIFQEQVIQLAMVAAGFSGGEADHLRRAMATWKKTGELFTFKEKLINGMHQRGYSSEYAERIFKQICGFGEYGFPESHSASFAVLAYVSSWLKYYYPEAFYTGLLNSWPMGFYPPAQLLKDAQRHGIVCLPVSVNQSGYDYQLEKQTTHLAIRIGLRQIKGLSQQAAECIVNNRPEKGYRYISEIQHLPIKHSEQQALASANALQDLNANRYDSRWGLMHNHSSLPLFKEVKSQDNAFFKQPSEFDNLIEDYAALGLTTGKHPIQLLEEASLLGRYTKANQLVTKSHRSVVSVVGLVIGRQSPGTASGVTFVTLEDSTGNINVIVWLATARAQKQAFLKSKLIKVNGILERGDGDVTHIIAGKIQDLSHLLKDLNTRSRDFH